MKTTGAVRSIVTCTGVEVPVVVVVSGVVVVVAAGATAGGGVAGQRPKAGRRWPDLNASAAIAGGSAHGRHEASTAWQRMIRFAPGHAPAIDGASARRTSFLLT